jgi:hypothetical protein
MTTLTLVLLLALQAQTPESKRVPEDSLEVGSRGCLKGRVFTATAQPEDERGRLGPDITGKRFRVSGPRAVMDEVKKHNGHLVEVVGIVRKAALDDSSAGFKLGGSRVVIGAPGMDPSRANVRTQTDTVPVMDLTSVRLLSETCPID